MSDESYEPLTSNRAVENAAISFFLAYEQVHGRGVPTHVEVLHLAGGYAGVRDSTTEDIAEVPRNGSGST